MNQSTPYAETEAPPLPTEVGSDEPVDQSSEAESDAVEDQPLRESALTVRELLDGWRAEYDLSQDRGRKEELAYRMVKLAEALASANLQAEAVRIRESEPNVLGFFVPSTGQVAMTPAGLEWPAEHYRDVLVHEASHAGQKTDTQVADEGPAQLLTRRSVPGAVRGIYETEQRATQRAFDTVGLTRALEAYDFDDPAELLNLYLEVEWQDAWRERFRSELRDDERRQSPRGRRDLLEHGAVQAWTERLRRQLEAAVPRLLERAEQQGFDLDERHRELFERAVEREAERG